MIALFVESVSERERETEEKESKKKKERLKEENRLWALDRQMLWRKDKKYA